MEMMKGKLNERIPSIRGVLNLLQEKNSENNCNNSQEIKDLQLIIELIKTDKDLYVALEEDNSCILYELKSKLESLVTGLIELCQKYPEVGKVLQDYAFRVNEFTERDNRLFLTNSLYQTAFAEREVKLREIEE